MSRKPTNGNGAPAVRPRVAAVSYLNTAPLVWGMLHGSQRGAFELEFCTPAQCADRLSSDAADIGIVPVIELERLGLEVIPGACIGCRGAVRSILLISRVPLGEIRTFAADTSSRTSVALARIILAERYGVQPEFHAAAPKLEEMLAGADAALIIGDPALHVDPAALPYEVLDLGQEWTEWTGLPMVFAVWGTSGPFAGRGSEFTGSARYGLDHIEEIVRTEAPKRGLSAALARDYLTRHVIFNLGEDEKKGMQLFLEYARRGVKV